MAEDRALALNAAFGKLRLRLLGDAVLRRCARAVAAGQGWPALGPSGYIALTLLQADALETDEAALALGAAGLVDTVAAAEILR